MGSSNDQELAIARAVDRLDLEDRLTEDAVPEILAFLNFKLASTDQDFLERYLQWRIENPIVK